MVIVNPNNWHWVDKNTLPWTETYFQNNLVNFSHSEGPHTITITSFTVNGDSNVSQRKGKVICYFDLVVDLNITVKNGDDETSGTIKLPEFMHDEDDIVYTVTCGEKPLVEKHFLPKLTTVLLKYQPDLIAEHSKDVQQ